MTSLRPTLIWELSAGQLRDVRIDDLLGRPVIELDASAIVTQLDGAWVVVTAGPAPSALNSSFKPSRAAPLKSSPWMSRRPRYTTSACWRGPASDRQPVGCTPASAMCVTIPDCTPR